jgi:hypothetical protein
LEPPQAAPNPEEEGRMAGSNNTTTEKDGSKLVVTLTDARGAVIFQETCASGAHACNRAVIAFARRGVVEAGDLLRVTVPNQNGEIHQPREID